jgi:hypothetical protein
MPSASALKMSLLFCGLLSVLARPSRAEEQRRFLTADSSKGRIAIVAADGSTEWETKIGPLHDLHRLNNGNLLFQTDWTRIVEWNPQSNKIVWEYDSAKSNGNAGRRIEVHAFQRLPNGDTMIAESGVSRIVEVDAKGRLTKQVPLQVSKSDPHRDTRLVRKLPSGNYLVCHEGDGAVREYDGKGKVVWEYEVPLFDKKRRGGHGPEAWGNQLFAAVRLQNGNTLISTGNGHSVIAVTPEKKIVWQINQKDLPKIVLAWVTTLEVLPNGNYVIGNCHAGKGQPLLVEIEPKSKKVVWTFDQFDRWGNSVSNTKILGLEK